MRLSSLEDVEDTVADVPVIDVVALVDLQLPDEEDGQREQYNLIKYLQDELEEKQAQQLPARQHTQEGDAGGDGDARGEGEDGMEALLVLEIRSTGDHVHHGGEGHEEEVHQEAHPDEQTGPLVTPDLAHAVADDVSEGEYEDAAGQVDRPQGYLLGFEDVRCNQHGNEEHGQLKEHHAYFLKFSFGFISGRIYAVQPTKIAKLADFRKLLALSAHPQMPPIKSSASC